VSRERRPTICGICGSDCRQSKYRFAGLCDACGPDHGPLTRSERIQNWAFVALVVVASVWLLAGCSDREGPIFGVALPDYCTAYFEPGSSNVPVFVKATNVLIINAEAYVTNQHEELGEVMWFAVVSCRPPSGVPEYDDPVGVEWDVENLTFISYKCEAPPFVTGWTQHGARHRDGGPCEYFYVPAGAGQCDGEHCSQ